MKLRMMTDLSSIHSTTVNEQDIEVFDWISMALEAIIVGFECLIHIQNQAIFSSLPPPTPNVHQVIETRYFILEQNVDGIKKS